MLRPYACVEVVQELVDSRREQSIYSYITLEGALCRKSIIDSTGQEEKEEKLQLDRQRRENLCLQLRELFTTMDEDGPRGAELVHSPIVLADR